MSNSYSKKLSEKERIKRAKVSSFFASYCRKNMIKKEPCFFCDKEEHVDAHHQDYDKPMEVIWLCKGCHKKLHKILEQIKPIKKVK